MSGGFSPPLAPTGANSGDQPPETRTHGTKTQANRRTPERRRTTAGTTDPEPTTASQPGTAEAGTQTQRKQHQRRQPNQAEDGGTRRQPEGRQRGARKRRNKHARTRAQTPANTPTTATGPRTNTSRNGEPRKADKTPAGRRSRTRHHKPKKRGTNERKTNRKNNKENTPKKKTSDESEPETPPRRNTKQFIAKTNFAFVEKGTNLTPRFDNRRHMEPTLDKGTAERRALRPRSPFCASATPRSARRAAKKKNKPTLFLNYCFFFLRACAPRSLT